MKTAQRHQLKEDDFLVAVERSRELLVENQRPITLVLGIVAGVALLVAGYLFWQHRVNENASALYADAVVTAAAPVAPPTPTTPPAPGTPAPPPAPPNSFSTEQARDAATLQKFEAAAKAYPSAPAGIASAYRAGALLVESGKLTEAQAHFNDVIARDANGLHGQMARLAVASIQVQNKQYDQAITSLQAMAQRTDSDLPVDAILMELGDAYRRAGRLPEAQRTYNRIVTEFPKSVYTTDARRQLDELKTAQEASHS